MKTLKKLAEYVAIAIIVIFGALWVVIAFVFLFIYDTLKPVKS